MKKRVNIKPSKEQSIMGFIVGLVFCGIGVFIAIPTFGAFGIFWTIIAGVITATNAMNAFSEKGIATHSIEIEETHEVEQNDQSIEKRLEQLKHLYQHNLITTEEYEEKKSEILQDL
ncbi:SHOCT domain-containing protein [Niameybacter massiliensis]|uniref:SHOCT domain-containing protein n=1 Tax=Niameybacter massiliensis TaxID=1658108 RepID=UPI0006B675A7|nr:SHOCT domain-containing protein [Niameybacter massiliensis]